MKDKTIFIKNVYYMLSYAFQPLRAGEYSDVETEEFENIHNLFAAILAKGIGKQLKQGLNREYVVHIEDLGTLRGKIDMPGTIGKRLARRRELTCEYDELSENNLLNQILKTTVMVLLRHGAVDSRHRDDLRKRMLFFAGVDEVDPATVRWSSIRFTRNNQSYRMLISVCQLVLDGMLITTEVGEHRLKSFLDGQDMSRLYEKFILEYYAKECPFVKASSPQIKWVLDDGVGTMLPTMQSDIVLTQGHRILIIDAKYYSHTTQEYYEKNTIHSNNLYQIFTYVKNKEAEMVRQSGGWGGPGASAQQVGGPREAAGSTESRAEPHTALKLADTAVEPYVVSGMLLYARTDEAIQPDGVYQMSGNQISVGTLDLNQEFPLIAAQLDAIAARHFVVPDSSPGNEPESRPAAC